MKFNNLQEVKNYFSILNKGNPFLAYELEEGTVSLEWYKAILEKVKEYNPKRVIDIGSGVNMFGFLFANEGIEYIGIDSVMNIQPIVTDNIHFIHAFYNDVKEQFKDDIIISCLCVGCCIPIKDVLGRVLIINDLIRTEESSTCIAKEIKLRELDDELSL